MKKNVFLIVNKKIEMNYNIYFTGDFIKTSILDIEIETLEYIIEKYKQGANDFTIAGKKYYFSNINNFQIFENSHNGINKESKIMEFAKDGNSLHYDGSDFYVDIKILDYLGKNVTKDFLGNYSYGDSKGQVKIVKKVTNHFINPDRIDELKKIRSGVDLVKLIRLCEELNFNFANQNYYSVAMLGRAIIDHIPPIFGMKSFNEVANNYGSKSIRGTLTHLNNSMRNISDGMLHSHIRKVESLPNETQVNFSQDFDVLLGEIILQFKKV